MRTERFFSLRFFHHSGFPFWETTAVGGILVFVLAGMFLSKTPLCEDVSGAVFRRNDFSARQNFQPAAPVQSATPVKAGDSPASALPWMTSMPEALAMAAEKKLPLLVHFYSPVCGPCMAMEKEVLSDARVFEESQKYYIMVRVNTVAEPGLLKQYGVQKMPTDIVFSHDGKQLAKTTGQKTKADFLSFANGTASQQRFKPQIASVGEKTSAAAPQEPSLPEGFAMREPETQPQKLPPMLEGFCVVTLVEDHEWVPGNPQHGVIHRGQEYFFTSAEKAEKFFANPNFYAVAANGNDVVKLLDFQETRTGSREYGIRYDNVNFVFASEETREIFRKDPEKYITPHRIDMLRAKNGETQTR